MRAGLLFLVGLTVLAAPQAMAQQSMRSNARIPSNVPPEMQKLMEERGMRPGSKGVGGGSLTIGKGTLEEIAEPEFPEVKYLEIEPPLTLTDRVDRILHGLRIPQKPQHDHYGYEIRRYMAKVASPKILGDSKAVKEQLKNAGRAEIIIKYWNKEMLDELKAIETQIETENATALIRSTYNYNSGLARAVMAEVQNWIDNNKKMLEFLDRKQGLYKVKYPDIIFDTQEDKIRFGMLYEAREKSLKNIKEYTPWAMMIY